MVNTKKIGKRGGVSLIFRRAAMPRMHILTPVRYVASDGPGSVTLLVKSSATNYSRRLAI
jgi:hypothetical protein